VHVYGSEAELEDLRRSTVKTALSDSIAGQAAAQVKYIESITIIVTPRDHVHVLNVIRYAHG
jgi:hypothetical protein